jgi:hypothetical protein
MSPAAVGSSVNANAGTDRRSHSDSAEHAGNFGHIYGITCFNPRAHTDRVGKCASGFDTAR